MDTRTITKILLKVTGIVLMAISIAQLPAYFTLRPQDSDWSAAETLGLAALTLGPVALLGAVLWFLPGTISNKIVSGDSTLDQSPDVRHVELIALTILGLYLLSIGAKELIRDVVAIILIHRDNPGSVAVPGAVFARLAATAVQILIGLGFCLGGKGILRLINRMRG